MNSFVMFHLQCTGVTRRGACRLPFRVVASAPMTRRTNLVACAAFGCGILAGPVFGGTYILHGKVVLEDGSPAPKKAIVERYCPGNQVKTVSLIDARGSFNWPVEIDNLSIGASTAYSDLAATYTVRSTSVLDCILRAALPGYVSSTIDLWNWKFGGDPNLP